MLKHIKVTYTEEGFCGPLYAIRGEHGNLLPVMCYSVPAKLGMEMATNVVITISDTRLTPKSIHVTPYPKCRSYVRIEGKEGWHYIYHTLIKEMSDKQKRVGCWLTWSTNVATTGDSNMKMGEVPVLLDLEIGDIIYNNKGDTYWIVQAEESQYGEEGGVFLVEWNNVAQRLGTCREELSVQEGDIYMGKQEDLNN